MQCMHMCAVTIQGQLLHVLFSVYLTYGYCPNAASIQLITYLQVYQQHEQVN